MVPGAAKGRTVHGTTSPAQRRSRRTDAGGTATLAGSALAFVLTAWFTFRGPGSGIDVSVLHWSLAHRPGWASHCDKWLVCLGSPLLMPPALLAISLAVAVQRRCREPVWHSVIVLIVLTVGVLLTKDFFARPGPGGPSPGSGHAVLARLDSPWAFPSGHATTALVTWTAGARLVVGQRASAAARLAPLLVAAVVSVALVTGGVHWLTDVVAAWPFAVLITCIAGGIAALRPFAQIPPVHPDRPQVQVVWQRPRPGRASLAGPAGADPGVVLGSAGLRTPSAACRLDRHIGDCQVP